MLEQKDESPRCGIARETDRMDARNKKAKLAVAEHEQRCVLPQVHKVIIWQNVRFDYVSCLIVLSIPI